MIVTLTLNPSLDRTVEVERLERGEVVRTSAPTIEPGGKGVNVTRVLTKNGRASLAIVAVAGPEGAELVRLLERDGIVCRAVPVHGRTRSNLAISESDGTVTKLNEPGSALRPDDLDALALAVRTSLRDGDWLVVSGSMPPELPESAFGALLDAAAERGAHLAVDTSGPALAAALSRRPRLVKPNRDELAELVGRELRCLSDVVDAAHEVRARGAELVLVSLGASGGLLVTEDAVLHGESPVREPRSAVGAGDCYLAGFLARYAEDGDALDTALLEALAWGAAATRLPGSGVPGPADLESRDVQLVWQPDLDRPLVAN